MTETLHFRTLQSGRVLVERPEAAHAPALIFMGFHGYAEGAAPQLSRLVSVDGSERFVCVAPQALHRFYNRAGEVVASWMTSQDRETMVVANVRYVRRIVRPLRARYGAPIVFAGFSQGASMAYRAALLTGLDARGVIAVGGDVPPELLEENDRRWAGLPVLIVRGSADDRFSRERFEKDREALTARGAAVSAVTVNASHEWNENVSVAVSAFIAPLAAPLAGR